MSADELRSGLVAAVERLCDDLAMGSHGDPHVGFVTFLSPDAPPQVIVISESGAHNIGVTSVPKDATEEQQGEGRRFYDFRDLADAQDALTAAESEVRCYQFRRPDDTRTLGQMMLEAIEQKWQRRRDHETETLLKRAEDERRRPVQCGCGRRFSERGHASHLARNRWCPDARAHQASATVE